MKQSNCQRSDEVCECECIIRDEDVAVVEQAGADGTVGTTDHVEEVGVAAIKGEGVTSEGTRELSDAVGCHLSSQSIANNDAIISNNAGEGLWGDVDVDGVSTGGEAGDGVNTVVELDEVRCHQDSSGSCSSTKLRVASSSNAVTLVEGDGVSTSTHGDGVSACTSIDGESVSSCCAGDGDVVITNAAQDGAADSCASCGDGVITFVTAQEQGAAVASRNSDVVSTFATEDGRAGDVRGGVYGDGVSTLAAVNAARDCSCIADEDGVVLRTAIHTAAEYSASHGDGVAAQVAIDRCALKVGDANQVVVSATTDHRGVDDCVGSHPDGVIACAALDGAAREVGGSDGNEVCALVSVNLEIGKGVCGESSSRNDDDVVFLEATDRDFGGLIVKDQGVDGIGTCIGSRSAGLRRACKQCQFRKRVRSRTHYPNFPLVMSIQRSEFCDRGCAGTHTCARHPLWRQENSAQVFLEWWTTPLLWQGFSLS